MKTLLRFECKKLLGRRSTRMTFFFLTLCITALSMLTISENTYEYQTDASVSGLEAIRENKAAQANFAGQLTVSKVLDALRVYQGVMRNPSNFDDVTGDLKDSVYIQNLQPYENILSLLRRNYSPTGSYDYYILSSVSDAMIQQFYEMRHTKVTEILNMDYSYGNYSQFEKQFIIDRDREVQTPFYYDYTDGWSDLLGRSFSTVFLLIGLAICVVIAPIFAYEYQTGADAVVLSSRFGRKRAVHAKILAGFLVSSGIFFFATVFYLGINFAAYGIQGWNASFQTLSFTAFYNLTISQVFLRGLLLNYFIVISVMSIVMWLSSVSKTSFSTVIISTLWVFVPLFVPSSRTSRVFNNVLNLLPAKAFDTYVVFSLYDVYAFGEVVIDLPTMIFIACIVITLLTLPLAHRSFRKHQVA